jgi:hypothetical protein
MIKDDLLLTIRESQRVKKIHGSLKSIFRCLIPKKKDANSFGDYKPISCCNVIYKIISKVISKRLKPMLSEVIGEEQLDLLHNR